MGRLIVLAASALAVLLLAGCTGSGSLPDIANVRGVVTYQGKPVESANIMFIPEEAGPVATGTTNAQGEFVLVTQGRNGALIGSHEVAIQAVAPKPGASTKTFDEASGREFVIEQVSLIPEKYGNPRTSGLTAHVKKGPENEYRFDLK